jgi:centrosomal protein CEP104
MSNFS